MIDEERPARQTVLHAQAGPEGVEPSWLTGSGRGLMVAVLSVAGILAVAAIVMAALALRTIYTGARHEVERRSAAVAAVAAEEAEGAARVARTEATRAATIDRIDSGTPAARMPIGDPAGWILPDDYPAAALRANIEGTVSIAWTVGSDGLVTDCVTTGSSGHGILDRAACDAIARRGRYPAVEMSAKPRVFERRVVWQIPG